MFFLGIRLSSDLEAPFNILAMLFNVATLRQSYFIIVKSLHNWIIICSLAIQNKYKLCRIVSLRSHDITHCI